MENKSHALIAGLFTLVLLTATVLGALWLNRDRTRTVPYEIATRLTIPGLNTEATVRYRGLNVGRVSDILFDPQAPGQILIRIRVREDTPVTRSTFSVLGYQGVTGIAYVDLNDDGSNPVRISSSAQNMARIEMRPSLLNTLEERGMAVLAQAEELTRRINGLLSETNQQEIMQAFGNISSAANALEKIPRQMQPTLSRLPALAGEAQQAVRSFNQLSRDLSGMSANLQAPGGAIDRIGKTADEVAGVADRFERDLLPLTHEIRATMRVFNRTLEGINERPQSVLFGTRQAEPGPGEAGFGSREK